MPAYSRNFRVDSLDARARIASQADLASVPFQIPADQSSSHARDITSSLGIGESLVGGGLLQALDIGNGTLSSGGSLHDRPCQSSMP